MAGEAQITVALQFAKGTISTVVLASGAVSRDVAGTKYVRNVQSVGTSIEALLLGDVTATGGLCILHNADPTNYIEVFPNATDAACLKLLPGDWQLVRFGSAAPNVKANTAACDLEYFLVPA